MLRGNAAIFIIVDCVAGTLEPTYAKVREDVYRSKRWWAFVILCWNMYPGTYNLCRGLVQFGINFGRNL